MPSTSLFNAPAQALLQDMATELAFVDAAAPESVAPLQSLVLQLAELLSGQAPQALYDLLDWFDLHIPAQWQAGASEDNVQRLYQWYEQLVQAWNDAATQLLQDELNKSAPPGVSNEPASAPAPDAVSAPLTVVAAPSQSTLAPTPQINELSAELPLPSDRLRLNLAQDAELLAEFCIEGRELLHQIEQGVLVLEEHPDHPDTLNTVFRAFHTFKGGAGFLALTPVKNLAHELESLLDAARSGKLHISPEVIEVILAGGDALKQFVGQISRCLDAASSGGAAAGAAEIAGVSTHSLLARVQAALRGEAAPVSGSAIATVASRSTSSAASALPVAPLQVAASYGIAAAPGAGPAGAAPAAAQESRSPSPAAAASASPSSTDESRNVVRLDTGKIDALVDLVGELLIAQSMVVQHPDVAALQAPALSRHLRQLARITSDLQRNAMSLRMVPLRGAFRKMNRLVRDLATAQGKSIHLQLVGEDIELDRNIVEQLADPLIHMVRNAVDHGMEMPAERLAAGKPEQGAVKLEAFQKGGGIVIRISDDGRGMDKARIVAKAKERGVVGADFAGSDADIFDLIFAPGFSTAESVTDVSGRGVGMDVVRSSISSLRGRIEVQSVLGQGSIFTLSLPLTLAVIDGMLVRVGSERFIIPTLSIRESFRPSAESVSTVQGKGEVINVRGKLIPLLRLGHELGVAAEVAEPHRAMVVVVESGSRTLGVMVDQLIGKSEVIIKSLGAAFSGQRSMSGAAILGDGLVTLILDPDALGRHPALAPLGAKP